MSANPKQKLINQFKKAQDELSAGEPLKAIRLLEKLLKPSNNHPDILYMISLANGKLGKLDMVKRYSKRVLEVNEHHHGALCNLANVLFSEGDTKSALDNYEQALKIKPDSPNIIENYCKALTTLGKQDKAVSVIKDYIEKYPDNAQLYASLGIAYAENGKSVEAARAFQSALAIDNTIVDANLGLGNLHRFQGNLLQSSKFYSAVLAKEPAHFLAFVGLATIHRLLGEHEEALEFIDKGEKLIPDNLTLLSTKVDILEHAGRYDEAMATIDDIRSKGRLPALAVIAYANMCRRYEVCDEAFGLIEETIKLPTTNTLDKKMLHFSAGDMLDKAGKYDEAFEHYKNANQAIESDFDDARDLAFVQAIKTNMNAINIASLPRSAQESEKPLFIIGMPRSGTTLTEQILDAHPDVYGAGELGDIGGIANSISGTKGIDIRYYSMLSSLEVADLNGYAQRYLDKLNSYDTGVRHVTDKMPHNFMHVGLIEMLFPKARIIHCTRNPLDNILSIYFQNFSGVHNYSTNLENIAKFYLAYEETMQHWKQVASIPIMTLSYEEMVDDQHGMSKKLLEFCDLEWDDRVLDFYKTQRSVGTASYKQVRQPMYKSSSERWRNYAGHLDDVKRILNLQ